MKTIVGNWGISRRATEGSIVYLTFRSSWYNLRVLFRNPGNEIGRCIFIRCALILPARHGEWPCHIHGQDGVVWVTLSSEASKFIL